MMRLFSDSCATQGCWPRSRSGSPDTTTGCSLRSVHHLSQAVSFRRGGGGVRDADQSRSGSPDTTAGYSLRLVHHLSQAVSFGKCVRDADQSRHGSWDSATSCSLGSTHHLHVFLLTSLGVEKYLSSLLLDFTQMF